MIVGVQFGVDPRRVLGGGLCLLVEAGVREHPGQDRRGPREPQPVSWIVALMEYLKL